MKRTCKRCRALQEVIIAIRICPHKTIKTFECKIGYRMKRMFCLGKEIYPSPLEECPKPLSLKEYWFQKKQVEGGIRPKCLSSS